MNRHIQDFCDTLMETSTTLDNSDISSINELSDALLYERNFPIEFNLPTVDSYPHFRLRNRESEDTIPLYIIINNEDKNKNGEYYIQYDSEEHLLIADTLRIIFL